MVKFTKFTIVILIFIVSSDFKTVLESKAGSREEKVRPLGRCLPALAALEQCSPKLGPLSEMADSSSVCSSSDLEWLRKSDPCPPV